MVDVNERDKENNREIRDLLDNFQALSSPKHSSASSNTSNDCRKAPFSKFFSPVSSVPSSSISLSTSASSLLYAPFKTLHSFDLPIDRVGYGTYLKTCHSLPHCPPSSGSSSLLSFRLHMQVLHSPSFSGLVLPIIIQDKIYFNPIPFSSILHIYRSSDVSRYSSPLKTEISLDSPADFSEKTSCVSLLLKTMERLLSEKEDRDTDGNRNNEMSSASSSTASTSSPSFSPECVLLLQLRPGATLPNIPTRFSSYFFPASSVNVDIQNCISIVLSPFLFSCSPVFTSLRSRCTPIHTLDSFQLLLWNFILEKIRSSQCDQHGGLRIDLLSLLSFGLKSLNGQLPEVEVVPCMLQRLFIDAAKRELKQPESLAGIASISSSRSSSISTFHPFSSSSSRTNSSVIESFSSASKHDGNIPDSPRDSPSLSSPSITSVHKTIGSLTQHGNKDLNPSKPITSYFSSMSSSSSWSDRSLQPTVSSVASSLSYSSLAAAPSESSHSSTLPSSSLSSSLSSYRRRKKGNKIFLIYPYYHIFDESSATTESSSSSSGSSDMAIAKDSITIYKQDLIRQREGHFFNDSLIDLHLKFSLKKLEKKKKHEKFFIFNSFFFTRISEIYRSNSRKTDERDFQNLNSATPSGLTPSVESNGGGTSLSGIQSLLSNDSEQANVIVLTSPDDPDADPPVEDTTKLEISQPSYDSLREKERVYVIWQGVSKWVKINNLLLFKDYVLVPINLHNHWSLVCIVSPRSALALPGSFSIHPSESNRGSTEDDIFNPDFFSETNTYDAGAIQERKPSLPCILHLDSLNLHPTQDVCELILDYLYFQLNSELHMLLPRAVRDETEKESGPSLSYSSSLPTIHPYLPHDLCTFRNNFRVVSCEVTHQTNGYDCGLYTILFAAHILENYPLSEIQSPFLGGNGNGTCTEDSKNESLSEEAIELLLATPLPFTEKCLHIDVSREKPLARTILRDRLNTLHGQFIEVYKKNLSQMKLAKERRKREKALVEATIPDKNKEEQEAFRTSSPLSFHSSPHESASLSPFPNVPEVLGSPGSADDDTEDHIPNVELDVEFAPDSEEDDLDDVAQINDEEIDIIASTPGLNPSDIQSSSNFYPFRLASASRHTYESDQVDPTETDPTSPISSHWIDHQGGLPFSTLNYSPLHSSYSRDILRDKVEDSLKDFTNSQQKNFIKKTFKRKLANKSGLSNMARILYDENFSLSKKSKMTDVDHDIDGDWTPGSE